MLTPQQQQFLRSMGVAVPAAPDAQELERARAAQLLAMAREGLPFPVRMSASVVPPFFSSPIEFRCRRIISAGVGSTLSTIPVAWDAQDDGVHGPTNAHLYGSSTWVSAGVPQPMPQGELAVVWAETHGYHTTDVAARPGTSLRWSMIRNGSPVPGFSRQFVSAHETQAVGTSTTLPHSQTRVASVPACPLILAPGDAVTIEVLEEYGATVDVVVDVRVWGWRFPDARATLQLSSVYVP